MFEPVDVDPARRGKRIGSTGDGLLGHTILESTAR